MKTRKKIRLVYNSPVILTYAIAATAVLLADYLLGGWLIRLFFTARPWFLAPSPGIVLHILGHANFQHLFSNFVIIMLVGPLLEEKYGSIKILFMLLVTALTTGILNLIFFSTGIVGASGVVFMMIILASFANVKNGEIPATFVFAAMFYIGIEIISSLGKDNISQFGHIIGGVAGGVFGLWFAPRK